MLEIYNYVLLLVRLLEFVECIIDFFYFSVNIYNWYNNINYFNYLIINRENIEGGYFLDMKFVKYFFVV